MLLFVGCSQLGADVPGRQVVEIVQQQHHRKKEERATRRFCAGSCGTTEALSPAADEESSRSVISEGRMKRIAAQTLVCVQFARGCPHAAVVHRRKQNAFH